MFRLLPVMLMVFSVLAQSVGAVAGPTQARYLGSDVAVAVAAEADDHHASGDPHHDADHHHDPFHEHEPDVPVHVHGVVVDPSAPQPRPTDLNWPVLALVPAELAFTPVFQWRPSNAGFRPPTWKQWAVGPPPSIRTTRLLI